MMRRPVTTEEEVITFFKKKRIVTWEQLTSHFGITSQALQKKIKNHPHLTSLNHNHRYLVLKQSIGKTNQYGIWSYKEIVFSIHGNTAKTVTHLIHTSENGLSARQLEKITSVMCRTILLSLFKRGKIARIKEGYDYIYLSSNPKNRQAQLKERGGVFQETLVESKTPPPSKKPDEIYDFLKLGEDDYLLRRLEMVRRIKSGKSKAQVAREMDCTPETVRSACNAFEEQGAKGLVITRQKKPYKITEDTEKEILIMKARYPKSSPERIGKALRKRGFDVSDRTVRKYLKEVGLVGQKKTRRKS